ncbi:MAG TPA: TIM44-like domain-containing protein, partial [Casimicrobiaceae bacterium]|nr:TIM44-like domain-containing protein [Casimicrobiaceae bacterium]
MKRLFVIAFAAASALALVHADFADAARMGGGRSFGMQRNITPPATRATPPAANSFNGPAANPVMPAPGATRAAPATAAAAAAPASRASRWLAPLAGIAAMVGLAALLSHFGLSEGFAGLLLLGLLAIGAIALVRLFVARRSAASYGYAGAGSATPRTSYEPMREPTDGSAWGSPASPAAPAGNYPPGFDPAPFLAQAKQQFRRLQAAYDRGDRALLDDVTTPQMQAEIARDLAARGPHIATDVVTLDADLLEVVQE